MAFLKTDALKYIVHLKMVEAYAEHIVCHYEQDGKQKGVLLLLPTRVNPFDTKTYPGSEFVVLLAATDQAILQRIIQSIPMRTNLVFKLVDDLTKRIVLQHFPSQRVTAFVSYTTQEARFHSHPAVMTCPALDERILPFYQANGYTLQEMQTYFQQGATSFTLYEGAQPLATCFTFRNYGTVWEIGGVYTHPLHRRQGFARRVVETALHQVLAQGYLPRYQVRETNAPSIRLAEAIGLKPFIITEHFYYPAQQASR